MTRVPPQHVPLHMRVPMSVWHRDVGVPGMHVAAAAPAPLQHGQSKPSFKTFLGQQQGFALGSSTSVLFPSPRAAALSIPRISWHLQGQQGALGELVAATVVFYAWEEGVAEETGP